MECKDLSFLQDLVDCLSGVPLALFDSRARLTEAICRQLPAAVPPEILDRHLMPALERLRPDCVHELRGGLHMRYLVIFSSARGQYLLAGPCLLERIHEMEFWAELREYNIASKNHQEILRSCSRLPMLTDEVFRRLGLLLGRWLLETEEDVPYHPMEHMGGETGPHPKEPRDTELKPFSRLAVAYIQDHLTETLTVQDTARALLVNADYLSDRFHREVGMTFIDFVNAQRTAQAAALLRGTALQIQQIATLVGYNSSSYFAKQFARHYRISPRDYRRREIDNHNMR